MLRCAGAALGGGSARLDAEVLLAHCLDKDRAWLYTWPEKILNATEYSLFKTLLTRRIKGEPVAYLTGVREFWSLNFKVTRDTLIPRPDTELLVTLAIEQLSRLKHTADADGGKDAIHVLDLGCGCGAIGIAVAVECPWVTVDAVDISPAAVAVTNENAQRLGIHITASVSDWFASVSRKNYHMILSNPPYIASDDPHLQNLELVHEPRNALCSDGAGLGDITRIASKAKAYMAENALLLIEHGMTQGDDVQKIIRDHGYQFIATHQDIEKRDRVTGGRKG